MSPEHSYAAFASARPRLARLAQFASGALLMLSFAPSGLHYMAPLLLLPPLASGLYCAPRVAAGHGFAFGCGLFLAGTYWLYVSIHVFGEAPLWIAVVLMLGLVLIMGLYYAATAWLISRLAGGRVLRFVAAAAPAWTLIEWLRGWILSGFPWMTIGYSQIDSPLAGFAPLIGVYGVSALVVLSASAALGSVSAQGARRASWLVLLALPWLCGYGLRHIEWTEQAGPAIATTIVQGGVPQDRKWLPEQFETTLRLYRDATLADGGGALIVWPEVALPATIDQVEPFLSGMEAELAPAGRTLVLGILERDFERGAVYNSVLALNGGERDTYRKRHLVPFGEFFPVPAFVRDWLRLMSLPHSDMTAGEAVQPLLTTAGGEKLAVAICYEDAYGAEQLYALPEAGILINVSNDAWFGDSIAPHQHLEIARMRALEAGRYVVRATNNGVSAFIDAQGGIITAGPQFRFVSLTRLVPPMQGLTPYARFGNGPLILLLAALTAAAAWRARPLPAGGVPPPH